MESDGHILSKHISTNGVNSRALDNIRSSNFNGSHTDPENDPGTQGWQILKNGFIVANQAVFRGTVWAARIISAVLESGALNIRSGGSITVGGDEETGVDPLVTLDESGLQVGDDVVIDSTGLWVDDGQVSARTGDTRGQGALGVNLSSNAWVQWGTETITVPSWANAVHIIGMVRMRATATSGTPTLSTTVTYDDPTTPGGASTFIHLSSTESRILADTTRENIVSPGSTVTIRYWALLSSGSTSANNFVANVLWTATR